MSFFSKVWSAIRTFFGSAPAWTKQVSTVITLITPLLQTLVALTAGTSDADAVKKIVAEVQAGLKTLGDLVAQGQSDGTTLDKVVAILNSIASNLSALLTAGHVKNDRLRTNVEVTVQTIVGEVQAVLAVLSAK